MRSYKLSLNKARHLAYWLWLALLTLPLLPSAQAGLGTPIGLWQLNGSFNSTQAGFPALNASTLVAGSDYSFATDGAGYQYLQTQVFTPAAKRLTVSNSAGPSGGNLATRTNQWTVVMDVKFDSFAPYAGLLQFDASNTSDVTVYLQPGTIANRGTLVSGNVALSADNAFSAGVWYRLALTCGNNGANGFPVVSCYLNGTPTGSALVTNLNGPLSLASTFHLFTDDNGELRPSQLGFLGLWGEFLSAADIARLGAPRPEGIKPGSLAYPDAPNTWGTWRQNTYLSSPRQISAAADPDGRLRLFYADALYSTNLDATVMHPSLIVTYRWPRPDATAPLVEAGTAVRGERPSEPLVATNAEMLTAGAMNLPRRMKVVTSDRGSTFAVRTVMAVRAPGGPTVRGTNIAAESFSETSPNPYFPRRPWTGDPGGVNFAFDNFVSSVALTKVGDGTLYADASGGNGLFFDLNIETAFGRHVGDLSDFAIPSGAWFANRTLQAVDLAVTEDTRDAYYAVSSTRPVAANTESEVRVFRHTLRPTPSGNSIYDRGISQWATTTNRPVPAAQSALTYPKILLTRAGEPRWVVWSDSFIGQIRIARRVAPIPDSDPSTNEDRRIASYNIVDRGSPGTNNPYFALGSGIDAALDSQDRLHVVWQGAGNNAPARYARENEAGTFDEITLPGACSQPPSIAIGPGDYPYVAFAGPVSAGSPLTIAVPPGLLASYKGDFEDLDNDRRPGLMERGQGTSDTMPEFGAAGVPLSTTVPAGAGVRRSRTTFRLAPAALLEAGTTRWHLADGADTLTIQPAYSGNMTNFVAGGFTFDGDFPFAGLRFVSVQDVNGTDIQKRQYYRLHVTRTPPLP